MKIIFRLAIGLIVTACALFIFLHLVFEETPAFVGTAAAVTTEDASNARLLGKNLRDALLSDTPERSLAIGEDEVNSCLRFLSRGIPRLSGRVIFSEKGIDIGLSHHFPGNIFGQYLNMHLMVAPSEDGLHLSHFALGKLPLPAPVVLYVGRKVTDMILGEDLGTAVVISVKGIDVNKNSATLRFTPIRDLKERLGRVETRFQYFFSVTTPYSDPALVRDYTQLLISVDSAIPEGRPISLTRFMEPLFAAAATKGGNPVEQNKAALLALSIFLGSDHAESFMGSDRIAALMAPFKTDEMAAYRKRNHPVVLNHRHDLTLHFLISAGIEILSRDSVSMAIGEFKELHDSLSGGSGFSFMDLAADRAGVYLAKAATSPATAKRVQAILSAHLREDVFFPNFSGLPEGIDALDFRDYFGNLDSREYQTLVQRIDQCIGRLPVHQTAAGTSRNASDPCNFSDIVPEKLQKALSGPAPGPKNHPGPGTTFSSNS